MSPKYRYIARYDKEHYQRIKIRKETYQRLKRLSQRSGLTMLDILDRVIGLAEIYSEIYGYIPEPEQVKKDIEEHAPKSILTMLILKKLDQHLRKHLTKPEEEIQQ